MRRRLKTAVLAAMLSFGTAVSAMAAEAPAKTWEEVKNSDDPMEIMRTVNAMSNKIDGMDTDFLMNMSLRLGEESIVLNSNGNIRIQDANNEAMKLLMTMNMNMLGETERMTAFYSDGWYYYDTESGKYKVEMDYAEALQNAQAVAVMTQDVYYVKDASVVRNGELTTVYYTMDGAAMNDLIDSVLSETAGTGGAAKGPGEQAGAADLGMTLGECKAEYTLDANGNILQQRVLMNMDMSIEDLSMGYEIFMEMNIKELGDSVSVTIPSTEGYPTMEEYLEKLLSENAKAA